MVTTRRRGRNNAIQTKTTTSFSREEENFGFTKMKKTTKKSKSKSKEQQPPQKEALAKEQPPRGRKTRTETKTKTTSKYEIQTQKSLQLDRDERFQEEHEPFLFGPYAAPCPEARYRKWLCADCPTCMKIDAPLYAIHNKYILSGYRTRNTFKDALRSVFKKHNETTNIWTHLIGMIFFFTFLVNVKEP